MNGHAPLVAVIEVSRLADEIAPDLRFRYSFI